MPQASYGFAVGQIRVLELGLLSRAALDRLAAAGGMDEFVRALGEQGFGDVRTRADIERACDRRLQAACELVRRISPEPDVTDCFLLKYDMLNLKVLLKSRQLALPAPELSKNGTIDPERLARCVAEHNDQDLDQPLRGMLASLEQRLAVQMDPLALDAALDKALYALIFEKLRGVKNPVVARYFRDKADLVNLMIALRAGRMRRGAAFARDLMVTGGSLDADALAGLADDPERAVRLTEKCSFGPLVKAALAEPDRGVGLAQLERGIDDHLLAIIKAKKQDLQTIMPVIGYLLGREREAAAVRLLAIGKSAGVPQEQLTARLRQLYV